MTLGDTAPASAAGGSAVRSFGASAQRHGLRFVLFAMLAMGMAYFAYKYYTPIFGGSDYYSYYKQYLSPLDFQVSSAPFAYRQVSAILTHGLLVLGVNYPSEIVFNDPSFDQQVFFAAMAVNYLALVGAAVLTAAIAERLCPEGGPALPLLAGCLCLLSFFSLASVLTGQTEGVSWLLFAVGFLGYLRRSLVTVGVVLALAILQRETITIAFGVLAACGAVLWPRERRFNAIVFGASVAAFAVYYLMRTVWIPLPGATGQTSAAAFLRHFANWRGWINKDALFQVFLAQNLLIPLGVLSLWRWRTRPVGDSADRLARQLTLALFAIAAALLIVGFGTLFPVNSVGRVVAIVSPVAAALLAQALLRLQPPAAA